MWLVTCDCWVQVPMGWGCRLGGRIFGIFGIFGAEGRARGTLADSQLTFDGATGWTTAGYGGGLMLYNAAAAGENTATANGTTHRTPDTGHRTPDLLFSSPVTLVYLHTTLHPCQSWRFP